MRILHIGDLHFKSNKNNYEQNLMITKMLESLKSKQRIDIIFFTGDLVFSGDNFKEFEEANKFLFQRFSNELKVSKECIIICQGNHDIDRSETSKAVVNFYDEKIISNDQLDHDYLSPSKDLRTSFKSSENFHKFATTHFTSQSDTRTNFYSIHKRSFNGKEVGIITINSAWLSCGIRWDLNHLMYPVAALKQAINKLNPIETKILLVHHPLAYFKEFNSFELENLIHTEFNLMFSGHLHKEQIATKYAGNNGIFTNTTQATLTFDKGGEIGYSIVDYNAECDEIAIERASYNARENSFQDLKTVIVHVPCGLEKSNQNKLRKKIISKFQVELENADELLLDNSDDSKVKFLDVFTPPVISSKSDTENTAPDSQATAFNYEQLQSNEENYLIFGKDKCGKTSLLKKLQLYYLKNYSLLGKTPFYLDYKELENKSSPLDIRKLIRNYYEITTAETAKIIEQGNLILLCDNLDTASSVNDFVINFLCDNRNVKFIICSDYLASRIYFEELDNLEYLKLYFKDLSRNEIRLYTEKRPEVKSSEREMVLERITKACQQLQLPINYWTISLILLIYRKSNDDYNKNLFGILDLCVDEILQKKQLTLTKSKLTFEQYKEICSRIAHHLLVKYRADVYSTSYSKLILFIEELLQENPRLVANPKEILDYLLSCGILRDKSGRITLRLNGLFEYFLAYYVYHHPDFKQELLANDGIYLAFKNELEIYSGFNRQDEEFLKQIFDKTKFILDKVIFNYKQQGSLDNILLLKIGEANDFAEKIKNLKDLKPLDHTTQDKIFDSTDPLVTESEVRLKEIIDSSNITHEVLEKYLSILSRVFRNSDNIKNISLIYEIFDYLVEAYCVFGFFLIDWVSSTAKTENLNNENDANPNDDFVIGEKLLKIITTFIPVLSQVMLYDGIGHNSIKKLIVNKIEDLKKDYRNNQYKLFMLYFLLMDIDLKENKNQIDNVFSDVTLGPLKVATFFKTGFYFGFKAYKEKNMEQFFKIKVNEAKIRLDEKSANGMNKMLSDKQKRNIVKRSRS